MNQADSIPSRAPSTHGISLALHDLGGVGYPVLAAHATGFNGLTWRPLAAALNVAHVVALDFRAHGGSAASHDADLSWDQFADDVLATLDALSWSTTTTRPVGIGHSMGGAALLLAELARPGSFAGIWVFEPIVFPPDIRQVMGDAPNPLAEGALRRRATFASRNEATTTFAAKAPMATFHPDALRGYVEAGFVDREDGSVHIACLPENESRVYRTAASCTAFERLGEMQCPVEVVRGKRDEFGPSAIAESVATALPHGRLVAHDELSHFGPMEDPVGLAHEIADFISSLDTKA